MLCIGEGWRGRHGSSLAPSRVFALLPAAGFVVQEHLEHFLASDSVPYELALEPTFITGLALQLPFALGALLLAGGLSALGYRFGRLLARAIPAGPAVDRQPIPVVSLVRPARVAVSSVLVRAHAPRAPPCAACS